MQEIISQEQVIKRIANDKENIENLLSKVIRDGVFPPPFKVTSEKLTDKNNMVPGDITLDREGSMLIKYIQTQGLAGFLIDIYDDWLLNRLEPRIRSHYLTLGDKKIAFGNIKILTPKYSKKGEEYKLYPQKARQELLSYSIDIVGDMIVYDETGKEITRSKSHRKIASIPLMLGSHHCYLRGLAPEQKAALGEQIDDPMGYFVVEGVEKIILIQELLRHNKIMLYNLKNQGPVICSMIASTDKTTKITVNFNIKTGPEKKKNMDEHDTLVITLPSLGKSKENDKAKTICTAQIFRLLGYKTEKQINDLLSLFIKKQCKNRCLAIYAKSIALALNISDDVEFIIDLKYKNGKKETKVDLSRDEKKQEVEKIITNDIFPQLNGIENINKINSTKACMLAIMCARSLEYRAGYRNIDNRDGWPNKKLEAGGRMMAQLFGRLFRKATNELQTLINGGGSGKAKNRQLIDIEQIASAYRDQIITDGFRDSFITANWGIKGDFCKNNVAQTLKRDNIIASLSHLTLIDVAIDRSDKNPKIRQIQDTQWGFVCPAETPEGSNIGILKHLAITAKICIQVEDNFLFTDLTQGKLFTDKPSNDLQDPLLINGKFVGWCSLVQTSKFCRDRRRSGNSNYKHLCIAVEDNYLYLHTDSSRLERPLLIVDDNGALRIDNLGYRPYGDKEIIVDQLLNNGCMEYVDTWEQEGLKVAQSVNSLYLRVQEIKNALDMKSDAEDQLRRLSDNEEVYYNIVSNIGEVIENQKAVTTEDALQRLNQANDILTSLKKSRPYTHCEIDPQALLGISASTIPFANHIQGPRTTYQAAQGKQSTGIYHSNHVNRIDGKIGVLSYPQRPFFEPQINNIIGLNDRPQGEQVIVAFATTTGYTQEDAFVFNKRSIDNGKFMYTKYVTVSTVVKEGSEYVEILKKPDNLREGEIYKYRHLGNNGLPKIRSSVLPGDYIIGKQQNILVSGSSTYQVRNSSVQLKIGEQGVVESVHVATLKSEKIVTVKLRWVRRPQEGDKYASRYAQKGTIGFVCPHEDLPFTESGITPDVIVNPHCIPSRMTVSYIMEILSGKYTALSGERVNATSFREFDIDSMIRYIKDHGFNEMGYENLRSGITGEIIKAQIFIGPCFFQALKHQVLDKYQSRGVTGQLTVTRQPVGGRIRGGGLRFGEMERDAAISHGAAFFARERLLETSDAYKAVYCLTCGTMALFMKLHDIYKHKCRRCGDDAVFGQYTVPYVYVWFSHLLAATGLCLRFDMITKDEYMKRGQEQNLLTSKQLAESIIAEFEQEEAAVEEEEPHDIDDIDEYEGFD